MKCRFFGRLNYPQLHTIFVILKYENLLQHQKDHFVKWPSVGVDKNDSFYPYYSICGREIKKIIGPPCFSVFLRVPPCSIPKPTPHSLRRYIYNNRGTLPCLTGVAIFYLATGVVITCAHAHTHAHTGGENPTHTRTRTHARRWEATPVNKILFIERTRTQVGWNLTNHPKYFLIYICF